MEAATAVQEIQVPMAPNTKHDEIERIYEAQKKNLQTLKSTSVSDRLKKIKKLRKEVYDKREKIQKALWDDFHKPAIQVDISEIYPVIAEAKNYEANLHHWLSPTEVETPMVFFGSNSKILHEPKGNVLLLCPWNYPFQIPLKNMIAAYAGGNAVIIKPSEFTPNTDALIREIVSYIFDENEVAVISGDFHVGQKLLNLRFDHIHFTGSPLHGKSVMKKAAETLTSVTLELGGKSPTIIDDTADLKATAQNFLWGKYLNSGQTCIAVDYVLIDEKKKDEFVDVLRDTIRNAYGEKPKDSADDCRIVNAKHFSRVKGLLDDAISKGAKVEVGGDTDVAQNYMSPTVLTNISQHMKLMEEEIFGPILPIVTYKNIDEAIDIVNSKEKPLALYIFSKSKKNQEYIISHTTAGATCINESMIHNGHRELPFGGVNNSGIGKSHGLYGLREFCNERPILKAWNPPSKLSLPPYTKLHKTIADLMLKYL